MSNQMDIIYDCGKYGNLTAWEIADLPQCTVKASSIYSRYTHGFTKEQIVEGKPFVPANSLAPKAKLYDCGTHGKMTVKEIAEATGINQGTAYALLRRMSPEEIFSYQVKTPEEPKKYNFGKYGTMTIRDASNLSGLSYSLIYGRIEHGTYAKESILDIPAWKTNK